jgi:hypothetical protein
LLCIDYRTLARSLAQLRAEAVRRVSLRDWTRAIANVLEGTAKDGTPTPRTGIEHRAQFIGSAVATLYSGGDQRSYGVLASVERRRVRDRTRRHGDADQRQ